MEYIDDFENFHDPENLNEMFFAPLIDDGLENLNIDKNGCEYYHVIQENYIEEMILKQEILFEIENGNYIALDAKTNFSEVNISKFKNWFYKYFAGYIATNTNCNLLYNWCDKFTKNILDLTMMYLDGKFSLYFCHSVTNFIEIGDLLETIARIPLEAELFALIEDDWGIFEDED
ncbi:MAG: hypothetical protein EBS93_10280 [Chitinophagia bacterium]|jgi:hypothetical protein|nr:hypothetical protein [Chitinophagia bacterium]